MMRMNRWLLSLTCGLLVLVGSLNLAIPTRVVATTGPSDFLPPSRYNVERKVAQLYTGRYQMQSVASKARLRTGAMGIEINDRDQLYGVAQFNGYEQSFQSIWIATLYNFHVTNHKVMAIDILAQTGTPLLGHLFLTRSANGDLAGHIQLAAGTFAITWRKVPQ
jgi:hypothetical protein